MSAVCITATNAAQRKPQAVSHSQRPLEGERLNAGVVCCHCRFPPPGSAALISCAVDRADARRPVLWWPEWAPRFSAGARYAKSLTGLAGPAGLEPATSWFVAQCRLSILLALRRFSSNENLLFPGVREQIVHELFAARVRRCLLTNRARLKQLSGRSWSRMNFCGVEAAVAETNMTYVLDESCRPDRRRGLLRPSSPVRRARSLISPVQERPRHSEPRDGREPASRRLIAMLMQRRYSESHTVRTET